VDDYGIGMVKDVANRGSCGKPYSGWEDQDVIEREPSWTTSYSECIADLQTWYRGLHFSQHLAFSHNRNPIHRFPPYCEFNKGALPIMKLILTSSDMIFNPRYSVY
jgi:hypothetical protein